MMKKYITERKWEKIYRQKTDGLCEKKMEDGSKVFTADKFLKYLSVDMSDYQIIGVRYQLRILKDKIKDYKLRHLSIGKVIITGKGANEKAEIRNISEPISWRSDLWLAIMIRDHLRHFINNTACVGGCIFEEAGESLFIYADERENDSDMQKWRTLVNSVADEFDALIPLILESHSTPIGGKKVKLMEKKKEMQKKAFADLEFIFNDLWW